jgi:hypothetical protein
MSDNNPYSSGRMDAVDDAVMATRLSSSLKVTQLVSAALIMGVLMFLGVVLVIIRGDVKGPQDAGLLTKIAGGFAALMVVNHWFLPGLVVQAMVTAISRETLTPEVRLDRLGNAFRTQLIIAIALLEGAAMFSLITVIVEKNVISLGVAVFLVILMLIRFPTQTRFTWWVQERL